MDLGYDILEEEKTDASIQAKIQQDYARVDVYFQTLNVRSIVQSPTYPVSKRIEYVPVFMFKTNTSFFSQVHWFQILEVL